MSFAIKIGNYRFSKNLGVGTFGKVKLAFNEVTGHKVAIKILNKKKIKQQGVLEKVRREINVLRQFNHPHIIKHFEFIDTPSDIFIVLEYAAGGELFDLISRKERLDEPEARRIFQQIISAIEYSHLHRFAHRDLKPENLLLDEDNNIKLIDFGLANQMEDGRSLNTACGSPNYAAPEVISGQAYGGQEVDIWSCGVILYAMVCGSLPFDDDQLALLFQKIKEGRYFLPNYVSYEVRDLINRMLQPNPVKRIKLREIQSHKWYVEGLPAYLRDLSKAPQRYEKVVDIDIVHQLFSVDKRITKSIEEVCKDIASKRSGVDYVGAYELMKHDKLKKDCFESNSGSQRDLMSQCTAQSLQKGRSFYSIQNETSWQPHNQGGSKYISNEQINRLKMLQQKFKNPKKFLSKRTVIQNFVSNDSPMSPEKKDSSQIIQESSQLDKMNHNSSSGYQVAKINSNNQEIRSVNSQNSSIGGAQFNLKKQRMFVGMGFYGDPNYALELVCLTLSKMDYEWYFSSDKRLKCRTKLDSEPLQVDESFIKDFVVRKFLKFKISILKEPSVAVRQNNAQAGQGSNSSGQMNLQGGSNGKCYMMNLQLTKGTPLVFMDFAQNFFGLFKLTLKRQEGTTEQDLKQLKLVLLE